MPQFGFYMAGIGTVGIGRAGLLLTWDPSDQGPDAADALAIAIAHAHQRKARALAASY